MLLWIIHSEALQCVRVCEYVCLHVSHACVLYSYVCMWCPQAVGSRLLAGSKKVSTHCLVALCW